MNEWTFDEGGPRWTSRIEPNRTVTIGWDAADHSFYLGVAVEPEANVEGSGPRAYSAPLTLLAASLLLPQAEHERLAAIVTAALTEVRDAGVIGNMQEVIALSIEPWPKPAIAAERMRAAAEAMPVVERLSLDLAAAGAWR